MRMSCDLGEATEGLENEQSLLQPLPCFTYVKAHSLTLTPPHLRHSSFSNPYAPSPTSQLILESFCRFTYVTGTYVIWRAARGLASHTFSKGGGIISFKF